MFPCLRSLTSGPRAWWGPCVSVSMARWAMSGDPRPRREEVVLQWRRGRGACDIDLGLDERAGTL